MATVPFPRTGGPARDALATACYTHLQELDGVPMRGILALHGMGPKSIGALRRAMAEHGWAFADDDPAVGSKIGGPDPNRVATGRNDNQTRTSDEDPVAWVEALPTRRQVEQGRAMLDLFEQVTGEPPTMWGPSIIGYGRYHYVYESGREGDAARVGFSPRKASLSLYGLQGHVGAEDLLDRLGPHRRGVDCVYVTNLQKVDFGVLRSLIALAWTTGSAACA